DAEAGRAAVGGEDHVVARPLAHEAEAALAVREGAVAGAEVALEAAVVAEVEPACRVGGLGDHEVASTFRAARGARRSPHFCTAKRETSTSSAQKSRASPAFCLSSERNARGSGRLSQTCGRNVPRCGPQRSTSPSTQGTIFWSRSSSPLNAI